MFYKIDNPPQWLLDGLYAEEKETSLRNCPDCGVQPGSGHREGCDVARCLNTGIQRLQCDCGKCGDDIWTGFWPGVKECYEQKLVCFDTATRTVMFDLTENALRQICSKQKKSALGTHINDLSWTLK